MSAQGSGKTAVQREAAALDLEARRDTIFSDMTTSFNGSYVFSGSASTVAPYAKTAGTVSAYAGSNQEMEVDVDENRSVRVAFDGQQITQGSDTSDIFVAFDDLIAAVRAGDGPGISQGMQALKRMFDRVSTAQGRVGADMRTIDEQKVRLDDMKRASAARLGELENANMAEAITGMQQADAAYRAALGAASAATKVSLMDYLR
jgi:flagellar hook-associated protein 3 FlgL